MPKSAKYLLIGSTEAYSGKSAVLLGLAHQLQEKKLDIAYGKPLGTCWSDDRTDGMDEDVKFLAHNLNLPPNRLLKTLLFLDTVSIEKRLKGEDTIDYRSELLKYLQVQSGKLVLLEGPGTLEEGTLFEMSLLEVAEVVDAGIVLVTRLESVLSIHKILSAKRRLGDRLIGVILNDVPSEQLEAVETEIKPFLEQRDIAVLGILPRSALLRSVSVRELVHQLHAEVICRPDRLDLMVESLTIGAMNVNSALKYFRKGRNMAVVTGGDRQDIQLAALETSTQCLILTGHVPPSDFILNRAEDLEIPILSVDLDTLTTVEIINRAFGQVRLQEPIKVQCVRQLMKEHFDVDRLMSKLGLEPAVTLP
ncbi:phosphotransacetylase family protein [Planktothrix sp. FACHB-1355]|uniref:Phosphotransacetylase family protein n=1 Tax=Aerosakkonema funiforme FACHB-1375 TaxID=2949571 RepID=A0A926ZJC2_9CYAN|nr:DRTGG domain-containing protein [Aerosakkonema funiforme]MBD2184509.1 phosphotransacetylase family protein [Aerosakkonema funiforme FACHB-1375]MBD3558034.1 phosphotransacetylase family protein [Planktothrix sp. FACHB-1355]